jgi:hypothetical protein
MPNQETDLLADFKAAHWALYKMGQGEHDDYLEAASREFFQDRGLQRHTHFMHQQQAATTRLFEAMVNVWKQANDSFVLAQALKDSSLLVNLAQLIEEYEQNIEGIAEENREELRAQDQSLSRTPIEGIYNTRFIDYSEPDTKIRLDNPGQSLKQITSSCFSIKEAHEDLSQTRIDFARLLLGYYHTSFQEDGELLLPIDPKTFATLNTEQKRNFACHIISYQLEEAKNLLDRCGKVLILFGSAVDQVFPSNKHQFPFRPEILKATP